MYVGNVMLVVPNLPLVRVWVKLLEIPKPLLYSAILVFACLGVFSAERSTYDVYLMIGVGVLGYLMRMFDIPVAPMIVGLMLGPVMEAQLSRALSISNGDASVFFTRPAAIVLLSLAALAIVVPQVPRLLRVVRGRGRRGTTGARRRRRRLTGVRTRPSVAAYPVARQAAPCVVAR